MSETFTAPNTPGSVELRLAKLHIRPVTAVAVVAALIVLVGDSQALALIPLLTEMGTEYHLTPSESTLVLAILGIVGAGTLPVITRLAERVSLRRFMLLGIALTTIGNAVCALSTGFAGLLIGRVILGLSAAMPIALALVREKSIDASGTNRALAVVTAAVGVGVAFSFLLGGTVLKLNGSVSTVFWIMTALGLLSFIAGWVLVPDYRSHSRRRVDYPGAVLLIIGLTLVAIGIGYLNSWDLWYLVLIIGLVVMAGWVFVELNVKEPMIDLRRTFRRSTVPAFFLSGMFAAVAVISNLAVTNYAEFPGNEFAKLPLPDLHYGFTDSVLMASLFLMPTAILVFAGGFFVGRIITRIGVKMTFLIASVLTIVGFGLLGIDHTQRWENMVGMACWGAAYALGSTAANAAFLHAAKDTEAGHFSAAATTVTATVGALAAPIFTAILYATELKIPLAQGAAPTALPTGQSYTNIWWILAIAGVAMVLLTLLHKQIPYQGTGAIDLTEAPTPESAASPASTSAPVDPARTPEVV